MKKKLIIFSGLVIILFGFNYNVYATGGGLRKNTIKTCPNGITYGLHSNGSGGTHWHVAITNGKNYYASGDAILDDPCPSSTKNEGTAGSTNKSNDNSNIISNENENKSQKNNDTSISSIKVDDEEVEIISSEMSIEVNKKSVEITVVTTDKNATSKIEGNQNDLSTENINIFNIIVAAEDGTQKTYRLNIKRSKVKSNVKIKKFIFGAGELKFDESNTSLATILKSEHKFDYSYELSDNTASLKVYNDKNELIESFDNVNVGDKYTLVITDANGNENLYYINVVSASIVTTIVCFFTIILIVLVPIILIVLVIKKKFKRVNK